MAEREPSATYHDTLNAIERIGKIANRDRATAEALCLIAEQQARIADALERLADREG